MFENKKIVILDGGLATELERRGHDLSSKLWSARLIRDDPVAIRDVHQSYLEAGADIVIAATYQVSDDAAMVETGLRLAIEARDEIRPNALVAASIGPYGAYLANGAEYTGDYELDEAALVDFHRLRWELSVGSSADLLACETIPSFLETKALLSLLQNSRKSAWFSYSCRNETEISDGTSIRDCAALLNSEPNVAAIGINCTRPVFVESLIKEIRSVSGKSIVVYPNSGELWDAGRRCWIDGSAETIEQYVERAERWKAAGATIIGGCCRTTPEHVSALQRLR